MTSRFPGRCSLAPASRSLARLRRRRRPHDPTLFPTAREARSRGARVLRYAARPFASDETQMSRPRYHQRKSRTAFQYLCSISERAGRSRSSEAFGSRWSVFDEGERLPTWACCYAIYLDGVFTYVGSTENLRSRISSHVRYYRMLSDGALRPLTPAGCDPSEFVLVTPWGNARSITIKAKRSARFADWLMTEARLILRLQPIGNKRGVERERTPR